MKTADRDHPIVAARSTGRRWVEEYLLPRIAQQRGKSLMLELVILQVDPDDESEAERLRQEGHTCDVVLTDPGPWRRTTWQKAPVYANAAALPFDAGRYHLVISGKFGRLAKNVDERCSVAREWARVLQPNGAVLLTIGNRASPLDLSGHACLMHTPWCHALVTLLDIERMFIGQAGFRAVQRLSLSGHFGWTSCSGALKFIARGLEAYLAWSSYPSRRWIYEGPLNPMLSLWITR
jgi:hypothetical protein